MDRFSESSLRIRAAETGRLRRRVLVASGDHGLRHLLVSVLKRMDLEVVESGLDRESRERVALLPGSRARRGVDVAIVDARHDPAGALEVLSPFLERESAVLVIASDDDTARQAAELGASILRPPLTATALRAVLALQ